MEKLIVMDYSDSSINIYKINNSDDRDDESILSDLGHNIDECSYMWCENDLRINIE